MTAETYNCPICAEPINEGDMCLRDIDEGDCHARCLEGAPFVDLDTGDPLPDDAPRPEPYPWRAAMTADLSALIARLEAAEAKDAWIHAPDVHLALFGSSLTRAAKCPAYTTSLDAALALAEMVLEERGPININVCLAGSAQAQIYPVDPCGPHEQAVASTPALALCIAILRAKQGEG